MAGGAPRIAPPKPPQPDGLCPNVSDSRAFALPVSHRA